jgi:hypothetical protein
MMAPTAQTTPIMAGPLVDAAQSRIAPESGLSTVIAGKHEDLEISAGRAARAPLVSADTITAETPGAFLHAGNPVSAAAVEDSMVAAVAADIIASRFRTPSNGSFFGHF